MTKNVLMTPVLSVMTNWPPIFFSFCKSITFWILNDNNFFIPSPLSYRTVHVVHLLANVFLLNVPFLVLRVLVKVSDHGQGAPISFMIIKNCILIMQGIREIYAFMLKHRKEKIEKSISTEEIVGPAAFTS